MNKKQNTINEKIIFSGIGLHTGEVSNMIVNPAPVNTGIIFKRIDLETPIAIPAKVKYVVETNRGTTIGINDVKIYTVEHFLSALSGLGIDNAMIDIDNIEPPVFDGSSKHFIDKILKCGIKKYNVSKNHILVLKPIEYSDDKCKIKVIPHSEFKITYYANFNYGNIGQQSYSYILDDNYINNISEARTFCSIGELIHLKKNGLIKGGSLDSGLVFLDKNIKKHEILDILSEFNINYESLDNKNNTLNDIKLNYANEPVRHKILDLIGDFTLLGASLKGHVISYGGGHEANVKIMKKIISIYG